MLPHKSGFSGISIAVCELLAGGPAGGPEGGPVGGPDGGPAGGPAGGLGGPGGGVGGPAGGGGGSEGGGGGGRCIAQMKVVEVGGDNLEKNGFSYPPDQTRTDVQSQFSFD